MAPDSTVKVAVFIDTNLPTHLAMAVSSQITAGDLKREFRREHFICFPSLGEIRINGLMVKRKSHFYHLPDSVAIKNVFNGRKDIWFLHVDANLVSKSDFTSMLNVAGFGESSFNSRDKIYSPSSSEIVSVTGIITRYFPDFDEVKSFNGPSCCVTSQELKADESYQGHLDESSSAKIVKKCKNRLVFSTPQSTRRLTKISSDSLPTKPSHETSNGKYRRTEVGNRVVVAASGLKVSTGKSKPEIIFGDSLVRNIAFEVSDGD